MKAKEQELLEREKKCSEKEAELKVREALVSEKEGGTPTSPNFHLSLDQDDKFTSFHEEDSEGETSFLKDKIETTFSKDFDFKLKMAPPNTGSNKENVRPSSYFPLPRKSSSPTMARPPSSQ